MQCQMSGIPVKNQKNQTLNERPRRFTGSDKNRQHSIDNSTIVKDEVKFGRTKKDQKEIFIDHMLNLADHTPSDGLYASFDFFGKNSPNAEILAGSNHKNYKQRNINIPECHSFHENLTLENTGDFKGKLQLDQNYDSFLNSEENQGTYFQQKQNGLCNLTTMLVLDKDFVFGNLSPGHLDTEEIFEDTTGSSFREEDLEPFERDSLPKNLEIHENKEKFNFCKFEEEKNKELAKSHEILGNENIHDIDFENKKTSSSFMNSGSNSDLENKMFMDNTFQNQNRGSKPFYTEDNKQMDDNMANIKSLIKIHQMSSVLDFIFEDQAKGNKQLKKNSGLNPKEWKLNNMPPVRSRKSLLEELDRLNSICSINIQEQEEVDGNSKKKIESLMSQKLPVPKNQTKRENLTGIQNKSRDRQQKPRNVNFDMVSLGSGVRTRNRAHLENQLIAQMKCKNKGLIIKPKDLNKSFKVKFFTDSKKMKDNDGNNNKSRIVEKKMESDRITPESEKSSQIKESATETESEHTQESNLYGTKKKIKQDILSTPQGNKIEDENWKLDVNNNDDKESQKKILIKEESDDSSKEQREPLRKESENVETLSVEEGPRRSMREKRDPRRKFDKALLGKDYDFTFVDYKQNKAQKLNLIISFKALLLMNLHAHLSKFEVIGLLGGKAISEDEIIIEEALPCTNISESSNAHSVEMDPMSQVEAQEKFEKMGYKNLGWYHSHPVFKTTPSQIDQETHMTHQTCYKEHPYIGVIIGPYSTDKRSSKTKADIFVFNVINNQTYKLSFRVKPMPTFVQKELEEIEAMIRQYKNFKKSIKPNEKWYLFKHLPCIKFLLRKKGVSYKDKILSCFAALFQENLDLLKSQGSTTQMSNGEPFRSIPASLEKADGTDSQGAIEETPEAPINNLFETNLVAKEAIKTLLMNKDTIDLGSKQTLQSLIYRVEELLKEFEFQK